MNLLKILSLSKNCILGKGVRIYPFSIITDSTIGSYSYVSYFCKINNTEIGKYCSIAQNVKIGLGKHPTNYITTNPLFYSKNNPLKESWVEKNGDFEEHSKVFIGNDVWIGTNVTVLDGVKIGHGAIIGAHSLVNKDVPPYTIVGGVPAKYIKMRFDNDIIKLLMKIEWWNYPVEKLKSPEVISCFSQNVNMELIQSLGKHLENT
jgi:acetyltransferase-like isoleucine patch superfamily enzyme